MPSINFTSDQFFALRQLSEMALVQSMWSLACARDAAALVEAATALRTGGLPESIRGVERIDLRPVMNRREMGIRDLSYPLIFAYALRHDDDQEELARLWQVQTGSARENYSAPRPNRLEGDRSKLFDAAIEIFCHAGQAALNDFYTECVQWVRDPSAITRLLDAGVSVEVKGLLRPKPTEVAGQYDAVRLAACAANVQALEAMAEFPFKSTDRKELSSQVGMVMIDAEASSASENNIARVIARTMALEGRSYSGLQIVAHLESLCSPKLFEQAMALRSEVLGAYLDVAAQKRIPWDPIQVRYLLGLPQDPTTAKEVLEGLPAQNEKLATDPTSVWRDIHPDALAVAGLRAHCHLVIEALAPIIQEKHRNLGLLPHSQPKKPNGRISALGAMMIPLNPEQPVDFDRFDRCLHLLGEMGVLEVDGVKFSQQVEMPAMHTLARQAYPDRGAVLLRLLDAGLNPEVLNKAGRGPVHGLPKDEQGSWTALVCSHQARQAAQAVLAELATSPQPSAIARPV